MRKNSLINRDSLTLKIVIGFAITIIIFLITTFYIVVKLETIKVKTSILNSGYLPLLQLLSKIELNIENDRQTLQKFINDISFKSSYSKIFQARYNKHPVWREFSEIDKIIAKFKKSSNIDRKYFFQMVKKESFILKSYYKKFLDQSLLMVKDQLDEQYYKQSDKLFNRMSYLNRKIKIELSKISTTIEKLENDAVFYHIILTSIAVVITIIMALISIFSILPIKKLIQAISFIKEGDFTHYVSIQTRNEIGILASTFNEMIDVLQKRDQKIKNQNKKLKDHHEEEIDIKNRLIKVERLAAIGKLSAQIAHEIRNPLNSITLNTDIIEDEVFSDSFEKEEIKPLFNSIKIEIERLRQITESYLQIAKHPKIDKKTENFNKFLDNFYEFIKVEFDKKGVNFLVNKPEEPIFFQFDNNKIHQVLLNLVQNGLHSVGKDGLISITVDKIKDNCVKIEIKDDGIGITSENQKKIFDPFFTTKSYGTGLGLFLVKQTIEEHGGEIFCESSFGNGAKFTIILK